MQISINEQKIDFSLENEKNLGDILYALEDWLKENNLYISEVYVNDNQELFMNSQDKWKDMSLEDIDKIDIKAITADELRVSAISSLEDYFEEMKYLIKSKNISMLAVMAEDFISMENELKLLMPEIFDEKNNILKQRFMDIDILNNSNLSQNQLDILESTIDDILILVRSRKLELLSPVATAKATAEAVGNMLNDISNVSAFLQTGQAKKAGEILILFSEYFQKLSRVIPLIIEANKKEAKEIPTIASDINSFLEEIVESYSEEDFVTVGDLFEYEVVPRLEELIEYINNL